jgi:hypothetical protein
VFTKSKTTFLLVLLAQERVLEPGPALVLEQVEALQQAEQAVVQALASSRSLQGRWSLRIPGLI